MYGPQTSIKNPNAFNVGRPGDRLGLAPNDADRALDPVGRTEDAFALTLTVVAVTAVTVTLTSVDDATLSVSVTHTLVGANDTARALDLANALRASYEFTTFAKEITEAISVISFGSKADFDMTLTVTEVGGAGEVVPTNPTAFSEGDDVYYGHPVYAQGAGKYSGGEPAGLAGNLTTYLAGIAVRYKIHNTDIDQSPSGAERFRPDDTIVARRKGMLVVNGGDAAVAGEAVYVGTGANKGLFFNGAGANREILPTANGAWVRPNVVELHILFV